jgi:ABC-type nitrate/sulfonate/bicarbonate transport system substrate-binding protein
MISLRTSWVKVVSVLVILLVLGAAVAACGAVAPEAAPAESEPAAEEAAPSEAESSEAAASESGAEQEMDEVTLRLSWRWKAEFAPLVLAVDKGFFEEEGIKVELLEGKGSGDVIPLIGNKTNDFGYLNLTTVALAIGKGMPVHVVAGLMGKHPSALAFYADQNIEEPKDLEGKSIALAPGEAFAVIYPSFAEKWEIDTDKVQEIQLDPNAKNQAFLEGQVDVLPVYANNELPLLRNLADKEIDVLIPGEWGFNTMANGIIVHNDTIEENPDLVRRFVKGVVKGYEYALEHPEEAVDAVTKRSEELAGQPREVLLEQVKLTLDFIHSPATEGKPLGWMADEDWNNTIDPLAETEAIDERFPNEVFYTNEFVPE